LDGRGGGSINQQQEGGRERGEIEGDL